MADGVGFGRIEVIADIGDGDVFHENVFPAEPFVLRVIDNAAHINAPHKTPQFKLNSSVAIKISVLCSNHRNAVEVEVVRRPYNRAWHVVLISEVRKGMACEHLGRVGIEVCHRDDAHAFTFLFPDFILSSAAGVRGEGHVPVILGCCLMENIQIQALHTVRERHVGCVLSLGLCRSAGTDLNRSGMLFVSCPDLLRLDILAAGDRQHESQGQQ